MCCHGDNHGYIVVLCCHGDSYGYVVVLCCHGDWRASVASETLTGVKMKKSGMFVYLFIYMDVRMSFCTLTFRIFVFAPRSTPSQTSLNRILRFSDHYPYHLRN